MDHSVVVREKSLLFALLHSTSLADKLWFVSLFSHHCIISLICMEKKKQKLNKGKRKLEYIIVSVRKFNLEY